MADDSILSDLENQQAELEKVLETLFAKSSEIFGYIESAFKGFLDEVVKVQDTWYVTQYQQLIKDLGPEIRNVTQEAFTAGDFSAIFNEGEKAAARSFQSMGDYINELVEYDGLALEDISEKRIDIIKEFGDTNVSLLHQSNEAMEKEAIRFSNAMKISAEDTAKLIGVMFAETGEASEEILTDITNQAKVVGDAVGLPLKMMAEGIKDVKLDMDFFTDITVEGAARMVASLSQLGMSIGTFKNLMEPFRDFDSAATKMGDLSAMFGIQMDAMEMMYLANEDEEQFLHRIREQILDQGIDVENMSKTRQRALAAQLTGGDIQQMKMFMQTGQMFTDQADLQAKTQEAATKTQADALETLNNSMVKVAKSSEAMKEITQNIQGLASAPSLSKITEEVADMEGQFIKAATNAEGLSKHIMGIQQSVASFSAETASGLSEFVQISMPALENYSGKISDSLIESYDKLVDTNKSYSKQAIDQIAIDTNANFVNSDASTNSWPVMFHELAKSLGDPSVPGGQEARNFYAASVMSWGDIFIESIEQSIQNISDSVNFEGIVSDFKKASIEIKDIASDVAISMASISSPQIRVDGGTTNIEVVASSISADLAQAVEESISKLEQAPAEVNVNVDIESLKADLIATLKEGFDNAEHNFELVVDSTRIANVVAKSTTSDRRTFQMRTV